MNLRALLERLARGRSFRRSLIVNGRRVPIHISPDAQLKYLKPGSRSFDTDLIELAESFIKSESIVWDIGANVGSFSVASAAMAQSGRVIAIEADIWLAGLLVRTAKERATGGRMEVLACAVAHETGTARFNIAARGRASNALNIAGGRSEMAGVRETRLVPMLDCDTLLKTLPSPTFVKIDVEGAEVLVLQGARELLRTAAPTIYIETSEQTAPAVKAIFDDAGYRLANADEAGTALLPFNSLFLPPGA